jgi:hypothetical protein
MSLARSGSNVSTASVPAKAPPAPHPLLPPPPLPASPSVADSRSSGSQRSRRRTAGAAGLVSPLLRHPTPSTSDIHSVFGSNIMALEQRAEEMSQGGSDIGEEIRKMNDEAKLRSRQSSIQSSHQGDVNGVRAAAGGVLGRMGSTRSRQSSGAGAMGNSSIVDVNGSARWGGYSPGGFISSPVGSVRSGSWSHASMPRKASASGSSRLAQMVEPMQEGRPLDSPLAPSQASLSRQASQSSFAHRYDQIAGEITEQLEHIPPSPPKHTETVNEEPVLEDVPWPGADQEYRAPTPPQRPHSSDTFGEAEQAFKDFDGVHFSPDTEHFVELDENGNEVRRVSGRSSSGGMSSEVASVLRPSRVRPMSHAEPPPADGMVFYPAPVPRMLNLPKRLSQLPAASVQAKRRTQILSQLPAEARHSAPWLSQTNLSDTTRSQRSHPSGGSGSHSQSSSHPKPFLNERMSIANLQSLPPQLRASVFFDHQAVQHDVEVKSESAVATLDGILAASVTAPVNAFIDHPFAGDVRKTVYGPENPTARRSTATLATSAALDPESPKKTKDKRRSSLGRLLRRNSSGDKRNEQLQKNESRSSVLLDFNEGGNKLKKRRSQMRLGSELDLQQKRKSQVSFADIQTNEGAVRTPGNEVSEPDLAGGLVAQALNWSPGAEEDSVQRVVSGGRPGTAASGRILSDNDQIEEDFKEDAEVDDEEGEPVYAAPTTLLAELQVRKANLKSRNRTAATAFPNGMHSTLLELDAVEQIKQKKRKTHRVPLAWEDPSQQPDESSEDDDVPLGMLFPGKSGMVPGKQRIGDGKDWDRPLGLMEKRELEESEPLSSRRNRLHGLPPDHRRPVPMANAGAASERENGEGEEKEEEEGETLAQRLRRLKTKDALDGAISDVALNSKAGEDRPLSTFTDDVLSQFGGLDPPKSAGKEKQKPDSSGGGQGGSSTTTEKPAHAGASAGDASVPPEEETLGQRRARLQREREASGEQTAQRPELVRSSTSLANLLSAHPVGQRSSKRDMEPAQGTLLHTSATQQAKAKKELQSTNVRASAYFLEKPLVESPSAPAGVGAALGPGGLLGSVQAGGVAAPKGGFQGGRFNDGLGGIGGGMPTSASTPGFGVGMQGMGSYFTSPTAAAYGGAAQRPAVYQPTGHHQQQPMLNPAAYHTLAGGGGSAQPMMSPGFTAGYPTMTNPYGYGMGYAQPMMNMNTGATGFGQQPLGPQSTYASMAMGMRMGMGMQDPSLDNKQRDAIDRWRMSVAQ